MKRSVLLLALLAACDSKPASVAPPATPGTSGGPASVPADLPKGPVTYYFGANEARSNVTFTSETKVTKIIGTTNIVNGSATVDFGAGTGQCHIVVPVAGLRTGMDDRDRAMWNPTWLDEANHKTIEFKSEKATPLGNNKWKVDGKFTLKGIAKDLSVEVFVLPIPEAVTQKVQFGDGMWARIKTSFKVRILDHGIKPDASAVATVQEEWPVDIDLYATTKKPEKELVAMKHDEEAMPVVVRAEKLSKDGLPGRIYAFGKKVQLATLDARSETPMEKITAMTNVVGGWLGIDAEKGQAQVRLSIPVKTLRTGIKLRDSEMLGPQWLDADKFPHIRFTSTKATKKDATHWTVEGNLEIHGVAKPVATEVTVTEIPAEEIQKAKWGDKPGLGFTTAFKIKLSDFGMKIPEGAKLKVNDEWTIGIDLKALLEE